MCRFIGVGARVYIYLGSLALAQVNGVFVCVCARASVRMDGANWRPSRRRDVVCARTRE
jgi:hypothetical protein